MSCNADVRHRCPSVTDITGIIKSRCPKESSSKQPQRQNIDRKAAGIISVLFRDLGVLNTLKSRTRESNIFRRGPEDLHQSKD